MINWFKRRAATKHVRIKAQQLHSARVELAHFEHMQDAVNAAVAGRRATIKRLEKELQTSITLQDVPQ